MDLNAWLTLAAIITGPLAAVIVSLKLENRRRKRESKLEVLRLLVKTRRLTDDPNYSNAINLVPVEFNDEPKVMEKYQSYIKSTNVKLNEENWDRQTFEMNAQQTQLIYAIMQSLGLKVAETEIQLNAYLSGGMDEREKMYLASLLAQKRIADSLETLSEIAKK